ncbi:MAG TPA: DUF417 family protein [Chitinophagaceae bacterium]|nr:DUF417 family protein [Chitinophagaceae bacterium]
MVHNLSIIISTFGIAVVLIWIGIFKFTPTEAKGIVCLVSKSPLMNWMYKLFSVQTTSNIIGIFEIVTALLLIVGLLFSEAGIVGSSFSIIIFFTTCTFMLTTGGFLAKIDGLWVPSDLGSFLIKDIVLLGAAFFLLSNYLQKIS